MEKSVSFRDMKSGFIGQPPQQTNTLLDGQLSQERLLARPEAVSPDGIAFAVLLANCTTPLLNRIHRQKVTEAAENSASREQTHA